MDKTPQGRHFQDDKSKVLHDPTIDTSSYSGRDSDYFYSRLVLTSTPVIRHGKRCRDCQLECPVKHHFSNHVRDKT